MMRFPVILVTSLTLLAACGGGGGGTVLPDGKVVDTPEFETYKNDHDSRNRVRSKITNDTTDTAALTTLDDTGVTPAGYLSLIDMDGTPYDSTMTIEVVAAVDSVTKKPTRILRLTADQDQFVNERNGRLITATGKYYFRGDNYSWVTLDDDAPLSGYQSGGLTNLVIDFDAQTASIALRTGVASDSEARVEVVGNDLPFNIRTGAYGGDISIQVLDPALTGEIAGTLRGNVGGTPVYNNNVHGMTTSGLYTGTGTLTDTNGSHTVTVDGVYFGRDPNATTP